MIGRTQSLHVSSDAVTPLSQHQRSNSLDIVLPITAGSSAYLPQVSPHTDCMQSRRSALQRIPEINSEQKNTIRDVNRAINLKKFNHALLLLDTHRDAFSTYDMSAFFNRALHQPRPNLFFLIKALDFGANPVDHHEGHQWFATSIAKVFTPNVSTIKKQEALQLSLRLLEKGADPNIHIATDPLQLKSSQRHTIAWADKVTNHKTSRTLQRLNSFGRTTPVLIKAIEQQESQLASSLLDAKADPNSRDDSYNSALSHATLGKNSALVQQLLNLGANPDEDNIQGTKPIDIAKKNGDVHILSLLETHAAGDNVSSGTSRDSSTCLLDRNFYRQNSDYL